jgi:hypothetical protein
MTGMRQYLTPKTSDFDTATNAVEEWLPQAILKQLDTSRECRLG